MLPGEIGMRGYSRETAAWGLDFSLSLIWGMQEFWRRVCPAWSRGCWTLTLLQMSRHRQVSALWLSHFVRVQWLQKSMMVFWRVWDEREKSMSKWGDWHAESVKGIQGDLGSTFSLSSILRDGENSWMSVGTVLSGSITRIQAWAVWPHDFPPTLHHSRLFWRLWNS